MGKNEVVKTAEVPIIKDTIIKEEKQLTADVVCLDCCAVRVVAVQDVHQVKRCVKCQEKYRKVQRKEYRKNLVNGLRARVTLLEQVCLDKDVRISELEDIIAK